MTAALKKKFETFLFKKTPLWHKVDIEKVSNWVEENISDAVQFAEWASNNFTKGKDSQKHTWFDKKGELVGTTEELYELFHNKIK